ncbi:MAG TPA: hypothetical protein VKK81_02710 [Candidatus Binatia bacterium]|nr:hypothetical protein [Candidatus Binatia bacterium]
MPIAYQIDHTQRLVDARAHGLLTDEDVFHYQREVWGRPEVVGYNEIVDVSNVSGIETESVERIRQLAELSAHMDPTSTLSKFAIVAPNPLYYDLGHLYQMYRELNAKSTKQVRVFEAREDALGWLDTAEEDKLPNKTDPGDT